jgi:hypothetical protein
VVTNLLVENSASEHFPVVHFYELFRFYSVEVLGPG